MRLLNSRDVVHDCDVNGNKSNEQVQEQAMFTHNASACTKTSDVTQVQLQGINFNLAYFGLLNLRWRHASFACASAWACLSRELGTLRKHYVNGNENSKGLIS